MPQPRYLEAVHQSGEVTEKGWSGRWEEASETKKESGYQEETFVKRERTVWRSLVERGYRSARTQEAVCTKVQTFDQRSPVVQAGYKPEKKPQ